MAPRHGSFISKDSGRIKCLGNVYEKLGYSLSALYVGDSSFDGIRSRLINQGFSDYQDHDEGLNRDEDLMEAFRRKITALSSQYFGEGRPFVLVTLTSRFTSALRERTL